MSDIKFIGRVLPEACKISMQSPSINWKSKDAKLDTTFTVSIKESLVFVECKVNQYVASDFIMLFRQAFDLSRACVDLVAFKTAKGLSVVLDSFVDPNGEHSLILPEDSNLSELCTVFDLNNLDEIYKIILTEPPLFMAMNDLIASIIFPHHSPVNCARVIEGIRTLIAPTGIDKKRSWSYLHENLHIKSGYLKLITEHSKAPRHGERVYISGKITQEIVRRTWIVMNRFLEFRKRGNTQLPQSEFLVLNGSDSYS